MSVFVHAQGMKTVHAEGVKKWQNSVHVVVECPLIYVFRKSRENPGLNTPTDMISPHCASSWTWKFMPNETV